MTGFVVLLYLSWKLMTYPFTPLAHFVFRKEKNEGKRIIKESVFLLICLIAGCALFKSPDMVYTYIMEHCEQSEFWMSFYKNYNLIVHLCVSAYTFVMVVGPICALKGKPNSLTDDETRNLNKALKKNSERDEAYWNGYWDGFVG